MDGTESKAEIEAAVVFDYLWHRGGGMDLALLQESLPKQIKGIEGLLRASDWFRVSGDIIKYVDIRYQSGNFPLSK